MRPTLQANPDSRFGYSLNCTEETGHLRYNLRGTCATGAALRAKDLRGNALSFPGRVPIRMPGVARYMLWRDSVCGVL